MKSKTTQERFEAKFIKTDGCWNWTAAVSTHGYGKFAIGGGVCDYAHRVAYRLYVGPIPDGLNVLHTCDNRLCVRPDHFFLGTHGDNSLDAAEKGRTKLCGHRGSSHHKAILNESQVIEIREAYATGNFSLRDLGLKYGVGRHVIHQAVVGKSWAHLPFPKSVTLRARPIHIKDKRGERSSTAKLTEDQVREIRRLRAERMTYADIARTLGLSPQMVRCAVSGHTWSHVK